VIDNVHCLAKIMEKNERITAAVRFEIKMFDFFLPVYKQLTVYVYTDVYCKLSKCIGQTPCSYEHYLANNNLRVKIGLCHKQPQGLLLLMNNN